MYLSQQQGSKDDGSGGLVRKEYSDGGSDQGPSRLVLENSRTNGYESSERARWKGAPVVL